MKINTFQTYKQVWDGSHLKFLQKMLDFLILLNFAVHMQLRAASQKD